MKNNDEPKWLDVPTKYVPADVGDETYAQWCKRNRPWEWLQTRFMLKFDETTRREVAELLRAAYDREDLKERIPNAKSESL